MKVRDAQGAKRKVKKRDFGHFEQVFPKCCEEKKQHTRFKMRVFSRRKKTRLALNFKKWLRKDLRPIERWNLEKPESGMTENDPSSKERPTDASGGRERERERERESLSLERGRLSCWCVRDARREKGREFFATAIVDFFLLFSSYKLNIFSWKKEKSEFPQNPPPKKTRVENPTFPRPRREPEDSERGCSVRVPIPLSVKIRF